MALLYHLTGEIHGNRRFDTERDGCLGSPEILGGETDMRDDDDGDNSTKTWRLEGKKERKMDLHTYLMQWMDGWRDAFLPTYKLDTQSVGQKQ